MKAQTAYMITSVLRGVTPSKVKVSGTQVATKTGTTSYDDNLLDKFNYMLDNYKKYDLIREKSVEFVKNNYFLY